MAFGLPSLFWYPMAMTMDEKLWLTKKVLEQHPTLKGRIRDFDIRKDPASMGIMIVARPELWFYTNVPGKIVDRGDHHEIAHVFISDFEAWLERVKKLDVPKEPDIIVEFSL